MLIKAVDEELLDIIKKAGHMSIINFYEQARSIGYDDSDIEFNIKNMVEGGYIKKENNDLIFIRDSY